MWWFKFLEIAQDKLKGSSKFNPFMSSTRRDPHASGGGAELFLLSLYDAQAGEKKNCASPVTTINVTRTLLMISTRADCVLFALGMLWDTGELRALLAVYNPAALPMCYCMARAALSFGWAHDKLIQKPPQLNSLQAL